MFLFKEILLMLLVTILLFVVCVIFYSDLNHLRRENRVLRQKLKELSRYINKKDEERGKSGLRDED
jgi:sensor domain CHASE-containing protein